MRWWYSLQTRLICSVGRKQLLEFVYRDLPLWWKIPYKVTRYLLQEGDFNPLDTRIWDEFFFVHITM